MGDVTLLEEQQQSKIRYICKDMAIRFVDIEQKKRNITHLKHQKQEAEATKNHMCCWDILHSFDVCLMLLCYFTCKQLT